MWLFDLLAAGLAWGVALLLRPWRTLGPGGPPWPWLAWWLLLPAFWGADRYVAMPAAQPLSGACLLMLMMGWPLAMLGLLPVAVLTALAAGLDAAEALHRAVWLGVLPATVAMGLGAAIRRWLPNHLFIYILGRGFFATAIAGSLTGALAVAAGGHPTAGSGLQPADLVLARFLAAWGDAFLAGMFVAIFVAFRPQYLATYADRIWLRADPPRP
jgi:uncharacterized membrane protein